MSSDTTLSPPPRDGHARRAVPARADRVPRSTIALLVISVMLPLVLFSMAALQNRRDVERGAVRRVERDVRILHEQALKVFDTQELMIDQLNGRLRKLDWSDVGAVKELHDQLAHLQALLPQVAAISITDAAGHVRATSRVFPVDQTIDVSDRDYFKALKAKDAGTSKSKKSVSGQKTKGKAFYKGLTSESDYKGEDYDVFSSWLGNTA